MAWVGGLILIRVGGGIIRTRVGRGAAPLAVFGFWRWPPLSPKKGGVIGVGGD